MNVCLLDVLTLHIDFPCRPQDISQASARCTIGMHRQGHLNVHAAVQSYTEQLYVARDLCNAVVDIGQYIKCIHGSSVDCFRVSTVRH